jgi:hypothetical protein
MCLAAAAIGAAGVVGWLIHAPILTTLVAERSPMAPNAGFALILLGLGAALRYPGPPSWLRSTAAVGCGTLVSLLGLVGSEFKTPICPGRFPRQAGPVRAIPSPRRSAASPIRMGYRLRGLAGRALKLLLRRPWNFRAVTSCRTFEDTPGNA